ncbi:MAG TPA: sugar ABC transporter permease [Thermoflexales bacterium]|nr:sugar ABC transporter permease [Thermoflexales bacterium]HQX10273.1 sugar ABC transporter permease [Thermoflexales bacterium]HQY23902.1 sugar ABC transporter permease [Thermoflexales bacterium]HQZ53236.1 sugar ABC transporter permease [Thermoflexales bacterium]HRA53789.1 sugar ABC transporter permease [Thermoflexales bacterium]
MRKRLLPAVIAGIIAIAAFGIRLYAIDRLPVDYDEDDYLRAAQLISDGLRAGDPGILLRSNYRPEHPPLQKIAFALAVLPLGPRPEIADAETSAPPSRSLPADMVSAARVSAAVFAAAQTAALALLNPLAAVAVAVNSYHVKYTSQVMLESLPSLTSVLCVLAYLAWARGGKRRWMWLVLSAVALGLTAASKYLYCIAGLAVVADAFLRAVGQARGLPWRAALRATGRGLAPLMGWGALALLVFFVADPYLWPNPAGRLADSIVYHSAYSSGAEVQSASFPPWQPFVWLSGSVAWERSAYLLSLDLAITLLALAGLGRLWRRQRVYAWWLLLGLGFLLVWNTKWPQYILLVSVPMAVAAGEGLRAVLLEPLAARWAERTAPRRAGEQPATRRDLWRATPWLLPGAIALTALAGFPLLYQGLMAMTDLNTLSLRDGITGGVFRAALNGLAGLEAPSGFSLYRLGEPGEWRTTVVHYTGLGQIGDVFAGVFSAQTWFSLMWAALSVTLSATLGTGVALVLNRRGLRFAGVWRALFVIPWAIPEFLGAVAWAQLMDPDGGWLSLALGAPLPALDGALGTLLAQTLAGVWMGFPIVMLTATAALKLIPIDVYDGAAMDGATGAGLLRHITLPLVFPLLVPALIVRAVFAFNQFYLFMPFRGGSTLASLAYQLVQPRPGPGFGRAGGLYAVSAAVDLFIVAALLIGVLALSRRTRAAEGVTYA